MTKRRKERPVEELRTTWTSTADLEETLSGMFSPAAPAGLAATVDVSTPVESEAIEFTAALIENVPTPVAPAPLSDKVFLSRSKKRLFRLVRPGDAHTDGENRLYSFLWSEGKDHAPLVRLYAGSMALLAGAMGRDERNTRPVVESLIRKLSIQVARDADFRTRQPRIYYVFHPSEIEARRRQAGLVWALKNKGIQLLTEDQAAALAAEEVISPELDLSTVELAPLETYSQ